MILVLMVLGVVGVATPAWAQAQRASGLSVGVGASDDSRATGPVLGGSLLVDLTPTIGVEGSGRWLDRGEDASAFAADLSGIFGVRVSERTVPYAAVGVGVYRASFDVPAGAGPPVSMPGFYARRFTTTPVGGRQSVSFTDPSLLVGAGVTMIPRRGWFVRPDLRMLFVRRDGATHQVLVATINVGIRFEFTPVTP